MSNFRNARFGLLPGAPRGANPMGPPLQNPNVGGPLNQQLSSSSDLIDGTPKLLCKLQYPEPVACGVYVMAPLNTGQAIGILDDAGTTELWVLGKAIVGIGGTSFSYEFDMPVGEVVQLQHVASYLEISARLVAVIQPDVIAAGHAMPSSWLFPPVFPGRSGKAVRVLAQGGQGFVGLSNPTRHARFPVVNANLAQCQPPPCANDVQILAKSDSTFQWLVNLPVGSTTLGPSPVPVSMCCTSPIPQGSAFLQVANSGAAGGVEMIWRLGLSGVQA